MTITLLRRVTSTRYIFILSGLVFILWSLATSLLPKSSTLSALFQIDLDQSTTQHATDATSNLVPLPNSPKPHLGLGIPHAHIYVISLPDRHDRREQMEFLRTIQGLTWTIVDAVPKNASLLDRILDWVVLERAGRGTARTPEFRWPEEIDARSVSSGAWTLAGSDAWVDAAPPGKPKPRPKSSKLVDTSADARSLTCATHDDAVSTFTNGTPDWMVLSPAKIACWYSHVAAIRRFVERPSAGDHRHEDDVAVLFEDDIDMEKDTSARLAHVWTFLPAGWDIVFLGHCWSDESRYPPLTVFSETNLHPSHHPKCTHAYALSHAGARRVLQHLRYPPFAYSRALDQAYAWLVRSGRLRSYSVVPSLVVQRKTASSDILPGSGSAWREQLRDGVFVV